MLCKLPKPVTFAIAGAVGCLIAAVCIGEPLHLLLEPDAPPTPKVDVMFVLDATASMQYAIDGTKSGIQNFADKLQNKNLDARVGLVAFRDRVWHPPQLDIAFVLDVTHSMQDEIDGVRDGIDDFATSLQTAGLDAHIGLVACRYLPKIHHCRRVRNSLPRRHRVLRVKRHVNPHHHRQRQLNSELAFSGAP